MGFFISDWAVPAHFPKGCTLPVGGVSISYPRPGAHPISINGIYVMNERPCQGNSEVYQSFIKIKTTAYIQWSILQSHIDTVLTVFSMNGTHLTNIKNNVNNIYVVPTWISLVPVNISFKPLKTRRTR